jgi:hypothetical protein
MMEFMDAEKGLRAVEGSLQRQLKRVSFALD